MPPEMIEIARELAEQERVDAKFEVGDMESLDLGRQFDACLIYDALDQTPGADLGSRGAPSAEAGRAAPARRAELEAPFPGQEASEEEGRPSSATRRAASRSSSWRRASRRSALSKTRKPSSPACRRGGRHLAKPWVYRALGPFWTQIWLRARAV